jgi:hypothetical protein
MEKKIFFGAKDAELLVSLLTPVFCLVLLIGFLFFAFPLYFGLTIENSLKYLLILILSPFIIFLIYLILIVIFGFKITIREDNSLLMQRKSGFFFNKAYPEELRLNLGGLSCLINQSNLVRIEKATDEETDLIKKFLKKSIFIKKSGIYESLRNKGIDIRYSFSFVSDKRKLIKISVKKLRIKSFFKDYDVNYPVLFVSLKNPERFLETAQNFK